MRQYLNTVRMWHIPWDMMPPPPSQSGPWEPDWVPPSMPMYAPVKGLKVTTARLHPKLDMLLEERRKLGSNKRGASAPDRLIAALREYVFNEMPLRLILLPEMDLIERNEIVDHIASKMKIVDEELLRQMEQMVDSLGKANLDNQGEDAGEEHGTKQSREQMIDPREEDARGNPWKAICRFLFQRFARYAILSHTWLPRGEIIYQDPSLKHWLDQKGAGFAKLKGFCKVSHRDHGFTLAWIDTLCINKESSAELDEAIQSMYVWYQNSSICITYLRNTTSLLNMKSDTWFQRGWTLQELIAPKSMRFYGRNWKPLVPYSDIGGNDKRHPEIQAIIYEATGIHAEELVSFDSLKGSDVPTRMRWAASRTTTRGEDRAYSLMGIFGVNFSISYGERTERAFFRLIEAIISSRHTSHIIQVLHWAGKAVSDDVHTTRLIPSGPECYHKSRYHQTALASTFFPSLTDPMALTHLGLRVRLLLVQVDEVKIHGPPSTHRKPTYAPFDITLTFWRNSAMFQLFKVILENRFPNIPTTVTELLRFYHPQEKTERCFYFGIFTFEENDDLDADCVHLPAIACAFLLGIPKLRPESTIQDVTSKHLTPTCKIDTRRVVELSLRNSDEPRILREGQNSSSTPYISIKKESLPQMGMKVVDAYL